MFIIHKEMNKHKTNFDENCKNEAPVTGTSSRKGKPESYPVLRATVCLICVDFNDMITLQRKSGKERTDSSHAKPEREEPLWRVNHWT